MTKITISISIKLAAFENANEELIRVLESPTERLDNGDTVDELVLRDINGNVCGKVETA